MFQKKPVPEQIEDLLTDHWEHGYKSGAEWQKQEDARKKEELIANIYSDGYSDGYDKGYSAGLKDGGGE
jgi:flagellar biosynthesis/type III secretory pathway protein FliH